MNLSEIAQHFGVSINTVSRALRNKSGVSEQLRAEIKEFAEAHHYIPNSFGSGLRGKKTNLIGVVIADSFNPAYFDEIRAIQAAATAMGFGVLLSNSFENIDTESANIRLMIEKRVDGLLIIPCSYTHDSPPNDYSILSEFNIPFVLMHRYIDNKNYDCVKFDNYSAGYQGVDHLINKGHKRILHLLPTNTNSSIRDRVQGYKKAYEHHGLKMDDAMVLRCNISETEDANKQVGAALDSGMCFTAILTYNDLMAFGAMKALYRRKVKMPDDIAVMGTDDIQNSDISFVPLTTVKLSGLDLGARAFKRLIDKMNEEDCNYSIIENVLPVLIERESV